LLIFGSIRYIYGKHDITTKIIQTKSLLSLKTS
jgi:hypothetical protein